MKDRVFSLLVAIFVVIMFIETFRFSTKSSWQIYGSSVYPRVLLIIVSILTLFLLIKSLTAKRVNGKKVAWKSLVKKYSRVLLVLFLTGLYIVALPFIGFIWSSILYLLFLQTILVGKINLKKSAISLTVSIIATLIIFAVFQVFLNVSLP